MDTFHNLGIFQKKFLKEFYTKSNYKIKLNKTERKEIWDDFKKNRNVEKFFYLNSVVPALYHEMLKVKKSKRNLQSAVFSECVYAQGIADQFDLPIFRDHTHQPDLNFNNLQNLNIPKMVTRYSYSNSDNSITLSQAGGAKAVDSAYVSLIEKNFLMIEFKEPYARTSEPDLPKYSEDGFLITSQKFQENYPQFDSMIEEQINKKLNVFKHLGNNVSDFSQESIKKAVLQNYEGKKYADVICTEDDQGYLVIIPTKDVFHWAKLEGEIRPSGRNSYKVWTPNKLRELLHELGAKIENDTITINVSKIKTANQRGGEKVSRLKINPLFFVRSSNVIYRDSFAEFKLNDVRQLNPSVSTKIKFSGLDINEVKNFYLDRLK